VPLTSQQIQLALKIDSFVHSTLRSGGGDEELLAQAFDYMPLFKQLLDTTTHEQMDQLCTAYAGFYRFAKLLELLAQAIQDGTIVVPPLQ
jgi:hypothetical protein